MSSNSCSSNCEISDNWCHTKARVDKVKFTWIIDHIDFHMKKRNELTSSVVSSPVNDAFKWFLSLEFKLDETDKEVNSIALYLKLHRSSARKRAFAQFSFTALGDLNEVIRVESSTINKFNRDTGLGWGFGDFLQNDDKFRSSMKENKLTITCDVEFSEVNNVYTSFHRCKPRFSLSELSKDLGSYMKNREFSDVTLSVNGKHYLAHKFVLAARSPVFAAMFRQNQSTVVTIEDMKEEILNEVLKYIYTGKCEKVDEFALELLEAADKYALDGLQKICGDVLGKSMTVENAFYVLAIADKRGMNDLKSEAIKFIVSKFTDVLNTVAWKSHLSSNPELVNEVCQAVVRR